MSFILDALRKVDSENRQAGVIPRVAGVEKLRTERRTRRRQVAAMVVIAAGSAATTALLLRRPAEEPAPPAPAAAAPPAVQEVVELPVRELVIPEKEAGPPEAPAFERGPDPPARPPVVEEPLPASSQPAPSPPSPREPPRLVLQGTSVLDGRPVAVVSDRRVFEGDIIEGAVVIHIDERSVELEFEGQRFTLTF